MYIYFDKNGKVNTILPHGEVPRQGTKMNLYLLFDKDDDVTNTTLRYKLPTKNFFEADVLANTIISEVEFEAISGESVGGLKNGETYKQQYFELSTITDYAGNIEISVTKNTSQTLGKAIVFVEPTLSLEKSQGIGMTISEYDTLIRAINGFKDGNGEINVNKAQIKEVIISGVTGDLLPSQDNTYNVGSNDKKWEDLHLNKAIYFGDKEVVAVNEDRTNAKFGLDDNEISFDNNKLIAKSKASFEFKSNYDTSSTPNVEISSVSNRVSKSVINFDKNALKVYDSNEIDITTDKSDGSGNNIKIGGSEVLDANTLTEIENAFSYKRSNLNLADFGITKDGVVYYKGYEIANLVNIKELRTIIENLDYYFDEVNGAYLSGIIQTGGQISVKSRNFDTSLSDSSVNAPQSKIVKSYVDAEANRAKTAEENILNNLNISNKNIDDLINTLNTNLEEEISRAKNEENSLANDIDELSFDLSEEISRAIASETQTKTNLEKEISRATNVENNILSKIPTQATSTNQLADKDFVNSSIATATATFRGTVTTLTELKTLTGDMNDYAYVKVIDTSTGQVKQYDRYKYSSSASAETGNWVFEYTLNNSSFTDAQWKALNSGVTEDLINTFIEDNKKLNWVIASIGSWKATGDNLNMGYLVQVEGNNLIISDNVAKVEGTNLIEKISTLDLTSLVLNL